MDDETASVMSDVLDGYEFFATLQLRTPLAVLEQHGRRHPGPPSKLPEIASQADGIWVPRTKSWSELTGVKDMSELPESKGASELGPIRPSEYVPFLIAFRRIIESDGDDEQKLERLRELPKHSSKFADFWARHNKAADFPEYLFWCELAEVKGVGSKLAKILYQAGYRDLRSVIEADIDDLVRLPGIGIKTATKIKDAAAMRS